MEKRQVGKYYYISINTGFNYVVTLTLIIVTMTK